MRLCVALGGGAAGAVLQAERRQMCEGWTPLSVHSSCSRSQVQAGRSAAGLHSKCMRLGGLGGVSSCSPQELGQVFSAAAKDRLLTE